MPLHPVLQAALDAGKAANRPPFYQGTVEAARAAVDAGAKPLGEGPQVHRTETLSVPGREGPIEVLAYWPDDAPQGILVYLHGGGWVAGSAGSFDALSRTLAKRSNCTVLNVDYRLAPDHPFPAGLHDAEDVLRWAAARRGELAHPGAALMVGGDSAGGNLAAVASLALGKELDIALQVLFYPVIGDDFETPSYREFAEGQSLTRGDMQWFFKHYAPRAQWSDPRVTPIHADAKGAPPAWIAAAEYDVLRSEGEAYARHLADAGVPVESKTWAGLGHGFARWFNLVDAADEAIDAAAAAIRAASGDKAR